MLPWRDQLLYEQQCIMWQQGLSEEVLRSLAADYLRGIVDESTIDAFHEYERRWGPHVRGSRNNSRKSKKAKKRRSR